MKVAVFYGGKSCEHEVSVATGVQIMHAAEGCEILPVYVGRDGKWISPKRATDIPAYRAGDIKASRVTSDRAIRRYTSGASVRRWTRR
ncbi:MAG: hypothetical protein ACLUSP_02435 [Christensenellales bacterium]